MKTKIEFIVIGVAVISGCLPQNKIVETQKNKDLNASKTIWLERFEDITQRQKNGVKAEITDDFIQYEFRQIYAVIEDEKLETLLSLIAFAQSSSFSFSGNSNMIIYFKDRSASWLHIEIDDEEKIVYIIEDISGRVRESRDIYKFLRPLLPETPAKTMPRFGLPDKILPQDKKTYPSNTEWLQSFQDMKERKAIKAEFTDEFINFTQRSVDFHLERDELKTFISLVASAKNKDRSFAGGGRVIIYFADESALCLLAELDDNDEVFLMQDPSGRAKESKEIYIFLRKISPTPKGEIQQPFIIPEGGFK